MFTQQQMATQVQVLPDERVITEREKYENVISDLRDYQNNLKVLTAEEKKNLERKKSFLELIAETSFFVKQLEIDGLHFDFKEAERGKVRNGAYQYFITNISYEGVVIKEFKKAMKKLYKRYSEKKKKPQFYNSWRTVMHNLLIDLMKLTHAGVFDVRSKTKRPSDNNNYFSKIAFDNCFLYGGKYMTKSDIIQEGLIYTEEIKDRLN